MYLGIEIGGTKLQLAVSRAEISESQNSLGESEESSSPRLESLVRRDIDPARGAAGILEQIEAAGSLLVQQFPIERIGIGFGGPVDAAKGIVLKSHQVPGWDNLPLGPWCERIFRCPAALGNDCDVAALAEARWGAGRGKSPVFYVTVGTGVGGGLIVDGKIYGRGRPAAAEIGHLRPGLNADRPEATVESLASGWGIAAAAQARISGGVSRTLESLRRGGERIARDQVRQRLENARLTDHEYVADLLQRCSGDPELLTAKMVAQAAADGNEVAEEVFDHAVQALGWAIAQAITLLAPQAVVVGGGVSLVGEHQFFEPLRRQAARYVFPPLAQAYEILPAALGEEVVVYGAIALAAG